MKKLIVAALLTGATALPAVANAQDAPASAVATASASVGTKVFGKDGAEIGVVEKVDGSNVVITVGDLRATIPANSLSPTDGGLKFTMTKGELETALNTGADKAKAAIEAALAISAPVSSKDGQAIATVQKVEGENVTLDLAAGGAVALAKSFFSLNASGGLQISMTAAEFQAATASATAASGNAAATTASTETGQ